MRPFLYALIAVFATTASAQSSLRLSDPALFLDDRRVATSDASLAPQTLGALTIEVPGNGTFRVSVRPFDGSARAGLFDGRGLFFHAGSQNVRLVSRAQILSESGPVTAYASYTPSRTRRSRGLAHLSVSRALDGRGGARYDAPSRTRYSQRGPRASRADRPARLADRAPRRGARGDRNQTAPRPASRYLRDSEARRLAGDLDRYDADRRRLAAERDRVAQTRTWTRPVVQRVGATAQASEHAMALAAERNRLAADRDRLTVERDQLMAALALAEAERDRLARGFSALRQRAEDAEARAARPRGDVDRELARLRSEQADLRAQIQTRDATIAALTDEALDRRTRLSPVEGDLADVRRQLAEAIGARDRAFLDRDVAYGQRDAALGERDQALADADQLRIALADSQADRPPLDFADERAALARDRALLDTDRAALTAERAALAAARRSATVDSDVLDERLDLITELSESQAEREALMAERAALVAERDRLAAALAARDADDEQTAPPASTIRTTPGPEGALAFLPGFDFARLQNPDIIRRRLDEASYPRWATVGRIEGDVLVLFQTDATGRVVRTAVPTPIGGGLDALAEEIVREMRFEPPVVDGQQTGLRSQVVVRFEL